ncbi:hypothetical protein [Xylophilus sp.]|uniref:hypothetical protein n=1 Tax=Xylophilus sp. TaxID=2653893 RepID=UPI0013B8395E|nr:hypothetical protein [Xylophilus sp.]KAF1046990.1 MAG: Arylsulfatase [Xylophilus sp.]
MRQGKWKAIYPPRPEGTGRWQLYDLAKDPGEIHDQAAARPERLAALIKAWDGYARGNGVVELPTVARRIRREIGRGLRRLLTGRRGRADT